MLVSALGWHLEVSQGQDYLQLLRTFAESFSLPTPMVSKSRDHIYIVQIAFKHLKKILLVDKQKN